MAGTDDGVKYTDESKLLSLTIFAGAFQFEDVEIEVAIPLRKTKVMVVLAVLARRFETCQH